MSNNKTHLSWVNPTQDTDGNPFDAAANTAGYTLSIDGDPAGVSIPLAFGTDFDMKGWAAYEALKAGAHTVAIDLITKEGAASAFSNVVTFSKAVVPLAPSTLAVA